MYCEEIRQSKNIKGAAALNAEPLKERYSVCPVLHTFTSLSMAPSFSHCTTTLIDTLHTLCAN